MEIDGNVALRAAAAGAQVVGLDQDDGPMSPVD
jgi:hypothetical protein